MLSQLPREAQKSATNPLVQFESRLLPTLVALRDQPWVLAAMTTPEPPAAVFRASGPGEMWVPLELGARRIFLFCRWNAGSPERDATVAFAVDTARAIAREVAAEMRARSSAMRAARAERQWTEDHGELEGLRSELDRLAEREAELRARLADAEERALAHAPLSAASSVLTGIAHDVRSPLTSILCNIEALQAEHARPFAELEPILADARLACERIESVVGSVRPLTEQARGPTLVDVHDCVVAAMSLTRLTASRAGVQVEARVEAKLRAFTTAADLSQILLSVLDNAIAASPRGASVCIEASRVEDNAVVVVRDAGPGFGAAERALAFTPFRSRKIGALGASLGAARILARKVSGDVAIRVPEPGTGGSAVEVLLKAEIPRHPAGPEEAPSAR